MYLPSVFRKKQTYIILTVSYSIMRLASRATMTRKTSGSLKAHSNLEFEVLLTLKIAVTHVRCNPQRIRK